MVLLFLVTKTKKNTESMCQEILSKTCLCFSNGRKLCTKGTMLLSKISKHLYMIILFIKEESIFVFTVYKILALKKSSNFILMIALKLMANKSFGCLNKVNMLNSKIMKEN